MSRKSVREAVLAFLTAPPITAGTPPRTVGCQWYPAQPLFAKGATRTQSGAPSGAVAWPWVGPEHETQLYAVGSSAIGKRVLYPVSLCLRYSSNAKEPAGQWQDDHDDLVQAIKTRIRSDFTFGGTLFSAGEGTGIGSEDLHVTTIGPYLDPGGGTVLIETDIELTVIEIVMVAGG